ncbi:hypothetical protein D1AOALGA4SA_12185 [Olavius algarvensis Delta 1 endosymbiont]|nr:hypothetical protein D1AOALGA4SA_12185 [Olavius algarvensis Delta 1 endosymbiont]
MARLYSNENFPLPVVEELRRFGHEVLTTLEAGVAGKSVPDEKTKGSRLHSSLYVKNEDATPLFFTLGSLLRQCHETTSLKVDMTFFTCHFGTLLVI